MKILIVLLLVLLAGCTRAEIKQIQDLIEQPEIVNEQVQTGVVVTRIIDGDTYEVRLSNGSKETVRVLGIDYPDIDSDGIKKWIGLGVTEDKVKICYDEGEEMLVNSLVNKSVILVSDSNEADKDRYGRLLRYVDLKLSADDVGLNLIILGYAIKYDPSGKQCVRCGTYLSREKQGGCLWK